MKRNIMCFLAIIIELLLFAVGIGFQIEAEYDSFYLWGNDDSVNSFYLDSNGIGISDTEIYDILQDVASSHSANLIKTDYIAHGGEMVIEKSILVSSPNHMPTLELSSGKRLSLSALTAGKKMVTKKAVGLLPVEEIADSEILDSFVGVNQVYIHTLEDRLRDGETLGGKYSVLLTDDYSVFLSELADAFHVDEDQLLHEMFSVTRIGGNFIITACTSFAVVCLIVFIVLLAFYLSEKFSYIGCSKLLGASCLKVWRQLFGIIVGLQAATAFFSIIVLQIISPLSGSHLVILLFFSVLPIVLTLLFLLIAYYSIRKYPLISLIKKNRPFKTVLRSSILAKVFISILSLILILNAVNYGLIYLDEYQVYQAWDEYGEKYAVYNSKVTDSDLTQRAQGERTLEEKYVDFYNLVNPKGAIYTRSRYLRSADFEPIPDFDSTKITTPIDTYMLTVNTNYLAEYPVEMRNGNAVEIPESETAAVYLLPESYRSLESEFQYLLGYDRAGYVRISANLNARVKNGIEKNASPEIKFIYYREGQEFFSFDTVIGRETNYYIKDPVFLVLTNSNITYANLYDVIAHSGSPDCTVKLLSEGLTSEELFNKYSSEIQECGLLDNITEIQSIRSAFEGEIALCRFSIVLSGCIAAFFVVLLIFVNILIVKSVVEGRRKELGIKMLMGYSFWARFRSSVVLLAVEWTIQLILTIIVYGKSQGYNNLLSTAGIICVALVVAVLDIAFMYCISRRTEGRGIASLAKGY